MTDKNNNNLDFLDNEYIEDITDDLFKIFGNSKKSKLYGTNGDLHEEFNHYELYEKLKNKNLWLLCYNNCDYIKDLYKDYYISSESWKYGMNNHVTVYLIY